MRDGAGVCRNRADGWEMKGIQRFDVKSRKSGFWNFFAPVRGAFYFTVNLHASVAGRMEVY